MAQGLYIGRRVDPDSLAVGEEQALLKADRLTRHAVCLGMTGSGKTGLCVSLLEELAMAGVPVIVIDPKGDMTNLALGFSDHRPEDFEPWVDPSAAQRDGIDIPELARRTSELWRGGLAKWGVDDARIRRFTEQAKVTIYTPGSTSGVPVDVLSALAAPDGELDDEGLRDLIGGTVSGLLGLVGAEADPINDPAHIVLSRIVAERWAAGADADLETVITQLVDPPFGKVGVFPVDTFYPRKERLKLAMALNGIVASPAFEAWRQGVALDVDALLSTEGRTPIHVFYAAHLDESQRVFFISTLLNRIVSWSRRQPGTGSLRALVYFDEVFGYLPPHPRNPPTKAAVLTLMKQARAVGLGTMLVTQNPVDLDYKALSNAGTWLVGRLQTQQDRDRVLDGLAGAGEIDRGQVGEWLEKLPSRVFVWRDVKEAEPSLVHSRWAISYLRGPLTRRELERLPRSEVEVRERPAAAPPPPAASAPAARGSEGPPPAPEGYPYRFLSPEVVFSARLRSIFADHAEAPRPDGKIHWVPALHCTLHLRFDEGDFIEDRTEQRLFFPLTEDGIADAGDPELVDSDFVASGEGVFAPLPTQIDEKSELDALQRKVREAIYRGETTLLFKNGPLGLTSRAGESREAFDARVAAAVDDHIDDAVAKLKGKVQSRIDRLDAKRDKLLRDEERLAADVSARRQGELISAGETLLGMFFGRKRSVSSNVSKRQQTMKVSAKLDSVEEERASVEREIAELAAEVEREVALVTNKARALPRQTEEVPVRLERDDVRLDDFQILWLPLTRAV